MKWNKYIRKKLFTLFCKLLPVMIFTDMFGYFVGLIIILIELILEYYVYSLNSDFKKKGEEIKRRGDRLCKEGKEFVEESKRLFNSSSSDSEKKDG